MHIGVKLKTICQGMSHSMYYVYRNVHILVRMA
jgi:hypothetical protein